MFIKGRNFDRELEALVELNKYNGHRNIIKLYGYGKLGDSSPYIATEFCDEDLFDYMNEVDISFNEKVHLLKDIIFGISWMHENNYVHRDIKLENVVLSFDYDEYNYIEDITVKLIDFSFAKKVPESKDFVLCDNVVGSPEYISPNTLIEIQEYDSIKYKYSFADDIYSFGILMYLLIYQKDIWLEAGVELVDSGPEHKDIETLLQKFQYGWRPSLDVEEADHALDDLITRCWSANPEDRPNCDEIIRELQNIDKPSNTAFSNCSIC